MHKTTKESWLAVEWYDAAHAGADAGYYGIASRPDHKFAYRLHSEEPWFSGKTRAEALAAGFHYGMAVAKVHRHDSPDFAMENARDALQYAAALDYELEATTGRVSEAREMMTTIVDIMVSNAYRNGGK